MIIRTHPMRFLLPGIKIIFLIAIPLASYLFLGASIYTSIAVMVFLLLIIFYVISQWYQYENDITLITNERVIVIHQHGFWKREIVEINLDRIQEVNNQTHGPLQTMFNYGIVQIQAAGSTSKITMEMVPRPYLVQQEITKRISGTRR